MKLFYQCPVKALYMYREFSVGFYQRISEINKEFILAIHPSDVQELILDFLEGNVFVQKQSLQIFDPKQDDIGLSSKNELTIFDEGRWRGLDHSFSSAIDESAIILRNGKQFFMPDVEND